jgi:hypothetical protein
LSVPEDDFTPHGLLWTPGHHARSWSAPVGGVGATDPRHVGAGFRLLAPRRFAALWIELALPDGALLATREQFQRAGRLWARVHTCRRILLRWQGERAALELLAYSAGPQALGYALHVRGATAAWRLDGAVPPEAVVVVDGQRLRTGERVEVTGDTSRAWFALDGTPPVWAAEDMAREDERFWAGAPRLSGDWPEAWRRGWVSDLETTRLLVQPPGGIYAGPWPSWMAEWPRAVAAEGSLDMARLAVADGATATAALETLWTQAPAPNLPCVFRDGQPNMVAADGRVCGTSPAWCLPVQQVERAFLWSGDRAWLARILPALAAYLEWWARERVVDGYPTYACTWESGEDDNPRLDPHGTGSSAILGRNRPPELPAALASGAQAIARLHNALGDRAGARRWRAFAKRYRTLLEARYWDDEQQRYRDLDPATGGFLEANRDAYWQTDSVRQSPLGLLAALATSDPARQAALARELPSYDAAPWRWWPSWSSAVLAAADALGEHAFAGRFAAGIVARVWRDLDARAATGEVTGRPLPGVAREYWPEPIAGYHVHDGYGWGAETATFFLRHIVGLRPTWHRGTPAFLLSPCLPPDLAEDGRHYAIGTFTLRGWRFSLALEPAAGETRVRVTSQQAGQVTLAVTGARDVWSRGLNLLAVRERSLHRLNSGGELAFGLQAGETARVQMA